MAEQKYGRLTLDVPDGWQDESTLLFVTPPAAGMAAPLSGRAAESFRANVSVSVQPLVEGDPTEPRAYLEAATALLRAHGAAFEDAGASSITIGGRAGWAMERVLEHGGRLVRQLTAVAIADGRAVIATASCEASRAAAELAALRTFVERIRIDD
jgi:hypothetical protein